MASELVGGVIERQKWLDTVADPLQKGILKTFESAGPAGQQVKNALHGTWLGHPVHSAITDVPVGAWTASVVCDAIDSIRGDDGMSTAADVALAVGLAGAVGSALTGLADFSATDGRARKIGMLHGLMNTAGALLFTTSYVMRRRDEREAARGFSVLGFAIALGAAYLGGKLVYEEQVGVDHTAGMDLPRDFVPVMRESDLAEDEPRSVEAKGYPVMLIKQNGQICAIAAKCSHAGGPLAEGKIEDGTVTCPWHASKFCLQDGTVIDGPATHAQPCFDTRVNNGQIEVRARL